MRSLRDGWYVTSAGGPMVRHIPNMLTDTAWDSRMEAFRPEVRPEGPGALFRVQETDAAASEPVREEWISSETGKTYVEVEKGVPVRLQYSGTGLVTCGSVRHLAETFLFAWIDIAAELVQEAARNGAPFPCALSPVQPTHRAIWAPQQGATTVTLYRIEAAFAYGHVEWQNRADPDCTPNFQFHGSRWWWIGPDKKLFPTPANKPGHLRFEAL